MTSRAARSGPRRGPAALAALAVVATAGSAAFGRSGGYTIRRGDTVSGLARRFGVTQSAIVAANKLGDPNRIYAGEQLIIPLLVSADADLTSATVPGSAAAAPGSPPGPPSPPLAPLAPPAAGAARLPADLIAHPSRLALRTSFRHWAAAYGVPAGLLEAVGWQESGWQATVVSATAAVGVGQIEPLTGVFICAQLLGLAKPLDPLVPDANIRMSAAYLAWLTRQTNGDVANALGGYYQGLSTLRARGPLPETRRYVTNVGALWGQFRSG